MELDIIVSELIALIRDFLWLLIPLIVLQFALFLVALISLLRKRVTFAEKLPWLLVIIIFNTLGPIIYFIIGSGELDKKAAEREDFR